MVQSLTRILMAFSIYEASVGYVQGMNFIAAVLLYHGGEVAAFWLLCSLMEKYNLRDVLSHGLPGLRQHEEALEKLGRQRMKSLFDHFDKHSVSVSLFTTDWIISLLVNFIPIEISHIYLDLFFDHGWDVFYEVCLSILSFYQPELLKLDDAGLIVGQIKQARVGCEHLLMMTSLQSEVTNKLKQGESYWENESVLKSEHSI